jgi:hypothetical protein
MAWQIPRAQILLVVANEEDDIWTYNDKGVKWNEVGMAGATEGSTGDESDDSEG